MKKVTKIALGVVVLFLILAVLGGSSSNNKPPQAQISNASTNPEITNASTNSETTATPKKTEAPDQKTVTTPATTTEANGSNFNNPVSMGETATVTCNDRTYEVSLVDSIRGAKANKLVKSDILGIDPDPGYEYLLVKAKVHYINGEGPANVNYYHFKAYGDGVEMKQYSVGYPKECPQLASGDFMPGATKEGWISYTVPVDCRQIVIACNPGALDPSTVYLSIDK